MDTVHFGGGVVFGASGFNAAISMNKFFSGKGDTPCHVRPKTGSESSVLVVVLTGQSVSEFVSIKNVLVPSTSHHPIQISTRDADNGGNSGNIIFMSGQLPQGLVDEEDYRNSVGFNGFVNNWGYGPQGLVRNT